MRRGPASRMPSRDGSSPSSGPTAWSSSTHRIRPPSRCSRTSSAGRLRRRGGRRRSPQRPGTRWRPAGIRPRSCRSRTASRSSGSTGHGRPSSARAIISWWATPSIAPGALATEAAASPERFSPNVLLRPIVQDTLFPTICYVAGPSELAYLGQLREVYEHFGVPMPLIHPRATATLADSATARFLTRYSVPLEDLQPQDESALNRLLHTQLPPTVEAAMSEAEAAIRASMERVVGTMPAVDPDAGRGGQDHARQDRTRAAHPARQAHSCREEARRHAAAPVRARPAADLSARAPAGAQPVRGVLPQPLRTGAHRSAARGAARRSREALGAHDLARRPVRSRMPAAYSAPTASFSAFSASSSRVIVAANHC